LKATFFAVARVPAAFFDAVRVFRDDAVTRPFADAREDARRVDYTIVRSCSGAAGTMSRSPGVGPALSELFNSASELWLTR
jgi:hypothetical protein